MNAYIDDQGQRRIPRVPEKPLFHVTEVVWLVAPYLGRSAEAVQRQLYRGIEARTIDATIHLGRKMIPRTEVIRILEGEQP